MNFPLQDTRIRLGMLFCCSLVAILPSYYGVRNARAAHYQESDTRAGYERAVQLEPGDPRNWYLLGRSYLYDLEQPDAQRALDALRRAVALDPYSAEALVDLANAYDSEGDAKKARETFLAAKRVYPLSADVAWSYGNFLLRQGDPDEALREIHKAVELDPKRAAEAFSLALRVQPDVNLLLNQAVPATTTVYLAILQSLSSAGDLDAARLVWNRLEALNQKVPMSEMVAYFNELLRQRRGSEAGELWAQAVSIMRQAPPPDPQGSLIWDGGFESGYAGGGFAWHFNPATRNVQIAIDTSEKHSGERSLRILFNGRENLNFEDGCHYILPQPGQRYLLSGWIRTQSLTSSEGVRLQIFVFTPTANESVLTEAVNGTQGWRQVQLEWTAPPGASFATVCARRVMSDQPGADIQGAAWIDDVSLVPASEASNKP
jgi:tetratricopeptide (TPR) repeat protein